MSIIRYFIYKSVKNMNVKELIKNIISPYYFFKTICLKLSLGKFKAFGKNNTFFNDSHFVGKENILIGSNNSFGPRIQLCVWTKYNGEESGYDSKIIIGDNNYFGGDCFISSYQSIIVKSGCCFGDNVYISDNLHGNPKDSKESSNIPPMERKLYSKGPIIIGDNVWIGRNVCVLGGVTIGNNAIVGANSVVTHDIEADSVYAGCPARRIR